MKQGGEGVPLCRQCATRLGVRMIVDVVLDGADIEAIFKDIMVTLANERRKT